MNIDGKQFMNIQEAVGWLLQNNALPFQCNVNYVADTEIAKTSIINPSPAEIKVGSLVLFADSKVGTVSGLTSNGFMVGSNYTDIKDALAYITNISINASSYLICSLSDGTSINAGRIKQVSSFSIDASQHLIANYNDGTTTDLGAIFTGNVNIAGNLTADSIIENMSGYSFTPRVAAPEIDLSITYAGVVKNGNKITFAIAGKVNRRDTQAGAFEIGKFGIPNTIGAKIFTTTISGITTFVSSKNINLTSTAYSINDKVFSLFKPSATTLEIDAYGLGSLDLNTDYAFRYEETFLLSNSL